jgi:hypothetical protein
MIRGHLKALGNSTTLTDVTHERVRQAVQQRVDNASWLDPDFACAPAFETREQECGMLLRAVLCQPCGDAGRVELQE